jgi:hypothetical protein
MMYEGSHIELYSGNNNGLLPKLSEPDYPRATQIQETSFSHNPQINDLSTLQGPLLLAGRSY